MTLRVLTEKDFLQWRTANGFKNPKWRFAATVRTPVERLPWYVHTLIAPLPPIREAAVHVSQVVFAPRHLAAIRAAAGIPISVDEPRAYLVKATDELSALLEAAFADVIDFALLPKPTPFALAADHDGWTRIFAMSKSRVTSVVALLLAGGVDLVEPAHQLHGSPTIGPSF